MRTSAEMFTLFEKIAHSSDKIRVMTLEGSRVNSNVVPDIWQDYDITFLVTDVDGFKQSDEWLKVFGDIVFMQKPEAMDLFSPDLFEGWYSYLMLFSDGIKIDLTLVPITDIDQYFKQDPLIKVLIDKDGICPQSIYPSDETFWIQKPSFAFIRDCANEFFFVCTYVAKGLLREELLFANWHFEQILRVELNRMLGYLAGVRYGFPLNTGKHNKWLLRFLTKDECIDVLKTYRLESIEICWESLEIAMRLFDKAMKEVCNYFNYNDSDDFIRVKNYIETLKTLK